MVKVITDIQRKFLQMELEGKIKKRRNPRKYSSYKRRIRERVDHMLENLLWVAEHCPEILSDREYENGDERIPKFRRAKAFLKAISLFENEPTVLLLLAEIYSQHQFEIQRK